MNKLPQTITMTLRPWRGQYLCHITGWGLSASTAMYGSTWALDLDLDLDDSATAAEVLGALSRAIARRVPT